MATKRERVIDEAANEAARLISDGVPTADALDSVMDRLKLNADERSEVLARASVRLAPYGVLGPLMDDPTVRDIAVNAPGEIWALRPEGWTRTTLAFHSDADLIALVERLLMYGETREALSRTSPVVDSRLTIAPRPRICATISPASDAPVTLTVRKYLERNLSLVEMASPRIATMNREMATTLYAAVIAGLNILISGGTGTGKTTILNALVGQVPGHERLVVIEDTPEVRLERSAEARSNAVRLLVDRESEARSADAMLRASLRMSPNRIVLGEIRGRESLTVLAAMNTGHDGSMATIHASGALEALTRLEGLCLMAAGNISVEAIRTQIVHAIDIIVQAARTEDGKHVISEIAEVDRDSPSLSTRSLFLRESDGTFIADEPPARWERIAPYWPSKLPPPWPGVTPQKR